MGSSINHVPYGGWVGVPQKATKGNASMGVGWGSSEKATLLEHSEIESVIKENMVLQGARFLLTIHHKRATSFWSSCE